MESSLPETFVVTYTIVFRRSVQKDVRRIPSAILRHIQGVLRVLQKDPIPVGSIKLQVEGKFYRIRIGSYRVVYEVDHEIKIITIVRIAHRKNVYIGF